MKKSFVILSNHIKVAALAFLVSMIASAIETENVNRVVAKVGSQVITAVDLNQLIEPSLNEINKIYSGQERTDQIKKLKQSALQKMISDKLLLAEANKLQLSIPPIEVTKRINSLQSQFATEEDFLTSLKERDLDLPELKKMVEDEFKNRVLLQEKVAKRISVLPNEIHDYYQLNISDYLQPASVHMFQIMVKKKPDAKKALAKAESIYKELKAGTDFQQLARLRSEGPKKNAGGDWGIIEQDFFGKDMATVEKSAFSLQPGKFGQIVETKFGYHIVYINSRRISRILSEREAYDDIHQHIFEIKFSKKYEIYMNSLRDKTYIEIINTDEPQSFTIKSTE